MSGELRPIPLQVKRKPRGVRLKDLEPAAGQCLTVPTDSGTTKCSGIVHGGGVLVTQLHHIWALVKLGCYGKGVFSRSIPCHQHIPSWVEMEHVSRKRTASASYGEEIESSWKKRSKLHTQWKKEGDGTAERSVMGIVEREDMTGEGTTGMMRTTSMGRGGLASGGMAQREGTICKEDETEMASTGVTEKEGGTEGSRTGETEEGGRNTEKEGATDYQKFVSRLKAIKTEDPYSIEEYLQLGPEEAFYLAAEVCVLAVETDEAVTLNTSDLWLHFTSLSRSFCSRYAAYADYRAGNWVPKSGLKFGVDFLLYKESPLSYHSSFAVIVKERGGEEVKHSSLAWKEVIAFGRVCESAKKDLLVCSVAWPEGTVRGEPSCINAATVTDILVKRWVPEKDRS